NHYPIILARRVRSVHSGRNRKLSPRGSFTFSSDSNDPIGACQPSEGACMKQSNCAFATAAVIVAALVLPDHARADGGNFVAGLFGGLIGGAIVGSALAPRAPEPVYIA